MIGGDGAFLLCWSGLGRAAHLEPLRLGHCRLAVAANEGDAGVVTTADGGNARRMRAESIDRPSGQLETVAPKYRTQESAAQLSVGRQTGRVRHWNEGVFPVSRNRSLDLVLCTIII